MRESAKKSSNQIISDFLTSNKKIILTVLSVLAAVVIIIVVANSINNKNIKDMVNSTTKIDELLSDLQNEVIAEDEFVTYTDSVIKDFKGTKAELIAYSRLGAYYFDNKDFQKAADNYTLAYTNFPKDFAVTVYMFNSAMAYEELGNVDKAIEVLEQLVAEYKSTDIDVADKSADIPETLFNLGRLYEKQGNMTKAVEAYETLVAEYQNLNITNLAKSRLLSFK